MSQLLVTPDALFAMSEPGHFGCTQTVDASSSDDESNPVHQSVKTRPLKKLGNLISSLFKRTGSATCPIDRSPSPLSLDNSPAYIPASPSSDASDASDYTLNMVTLTPTRADSVGWSEQVLTEMLQHLSCDESEPVERSKSQLSLSDVDDGTLVNSCADLLDWSPSSSVETSPGEPSEPEKPIALDMVELEASLCAMSSPEPPPDFLATHCLVAQDSLATQEETTKMHGWSRFTPGRERGLYFLSHAKLTGNLSRINMYSFNNDSSLRACVAPDCTKPGYCIAKTCSQIMKQPTIVPGKFTLQEQVCISNLMIHFMELHREDWDDVMNHCDEGEFEHAPLLEEPADLTMQQVEEAERGREHEPHGQSPLEPSEVCSHLHHHHLDASDWSNVAKDGKRWPVRRTWSDLSLDWEDEEASRPDLNIRTTRTPSPEPPKWNVTSPSTIQHLVWTPSVHRLM